MIRLDATWVHSSFGSQRALKREMERGRDERGTVHSSFGSQRALKLRFRKPTLVDQVVHSSFGSQRALKLECVGQRLALGCAIHKFIRPSAHREH